MNELIREALKTFVSKSLAEGERVLDVGSIGSEYLPLFDDAKVYRIDPNFYAETEYVKSSFLDANLYGYEVFDWVILIDVLQYAGQQAYKLEYFADGMEWMLYHALQVAKPAAILIFGVPVGEAKVVYQSGIGNCRILDWEEYRRIRQVTQPVMELFLTPKGIPTTTPQDYEQVYALLIARRVSILAKPHTDTEESERVIDVDDAHGDEARAGEEPSWALSDSWMQDLQGLIEPKGNKTKRGR